MSGSYPVASVKEAGKVNRVDLSKADGIKENTMLDGKAWKKYHSQSGLIDFKQAKLDGPTQNAETYMSFWVFSPRPLDDLLIEPNMPVVDLEVAADDAVQVWLNGKMIISNLREGPKVVKPYQKGCLCTKAGITSLSKLFKAEAVGSSTDV